MLSDFADLAYSKQSQPVKKAFWVQVNAEGGLVEFTDLSIDKASVRQVISPGSGYLAHKKMPTPPRTPLGLYA